ncbi:MAG: enoyl-CoA hydratase-related protein [Acidimicrobiia bacterium]
MPDILCEIDRGVALLTLNRPDSLNAWTPDMEDEWNDFLDSLAVDPAVRVLVVTGAGKHFCPGLDIKLLAQRSAAGIVPPKRQRPLTAVADYPKPVIGAINGACIGLALAWAAAFDIRFGSTTTKLSAPFARRGLVAEFATGWTLPRLIGHANAMDLLISGRTIEADEALSMGLLNRVVAPDELVPAALDYAREIAELCSPTAMATAKAQVAGDWNRSRAEAERHSRELWEQDAQRVDFAEGIAANRERRSPNFAPLAPAWPPNAV